MAKKKNASFGPAIFYKFMAGWVVVMAVILGATAYFHYQDSECANSQSCIKDLSGAYDATATNGIFMGRTVDVPSNVAFDSVHTNVLGESTSAKRIEVDLTNQKLYAYDGDKLVYNFPVSTGKWHHTPTGNFNIWIKLRYTRMKGGNKALGTFYDLPNVPYTMYFYNSEYPKTDGYGIHGAYWHNNFGHPMSHGCINMAEADVAQLYAWADPATVGNTTYASAESPGTPVIIYGTTPNE
jgi:hypothetical protein